MSLVAPAPTRHRMADQLRGIALLGILVVNAPFLAISGIGYTEESLTGTLNTVVAAAVVFLAEGKFYLIFSLLFGYSTTFIMRPDDTASSRRYRRRLAALAVLGVLHAILLFIGDILLSYALLGLVLMWLVPWPDQWVMRVSRLAWVLSAGWLLLVLVAVWNGDITENSGAWTAYDYAMANGSFLDTVRARVLALPETVLTLASLQWALAFAAFGVGMVAGRRKLFAEPAAHVALWRRLALWGVLLGVPLQAATTTLAFTTNQGPHAEAIALTGVILGFLTAPVLSAGYVGLFGLMSARSPELFRVSEPAGRMSLTIYLSESALLCLLYCGWGLGWFGSQGAGAVTMIAVFVWLLLAVFAWLWLRSFSKGPVETILSRWVQRGRPG